MNYEDNRNAILEANAQTGTFGPYFENPYTNSKRVELVGLNMGHLRRRAGMSQKEVCDIIGVAPQTYSGYEKGKHEPTIETLVRLANLYHVSVDFIVRKDEDTGCYDASEYFENIIENQTFEDLQIEVHQLREEMKVIKAQISKQK